ncbi:hypothetical protein Tco_0787632, partial [Tanacetum coccineum]
DPLDKLNDLVNKKRRHADDIHDYFKANKRLKSSVQYEDYLPDLKDFSNTMLYTVQEVFFRHHQGPGLDDHARTFNSLLLTKVDKRNLNLLKQMRTIEQLRHSSGPLKIGKYLHFSLCSGTEIEEGLWKELQFSLVDNSKLNVVYLLNRSLKRLFQF